MGNRAVITTRDRKIGLYLHWNGGRDTVEPLLAYCKMQGYRPPEKDDYGWARMCQVMGNFFGGNASLGIDVYDGTNPGDNGVYIIENWQVVDREYPKGRCGEQQEHDFDEMLHALDACMPEHCRLGGYLDAEEVPIGEIRMGDEIWMGTWDGRKELHTVLGFGKGYSNGRKLDGLPYVDLYENDGTYARNCNNYPWTPTVRRAKKEA